jgi:hypothetical protein
MRTTLQICAPVAHEESDGDTVSPLGDANGGSDSDKEAVGDSDKDMDADDDQPALLLPLAFEIDLDIDIRSLALRDMASVDPIVCEPVPQLFAHTAAPDTSNAELDWNW